MKKVRTMTVLLLLAMMFSCSMGYTEASTLPTMYDFTVAQDGSTRFKTIMEALRAVPIPVTRRFTIHVTAGVYLEYIEITSSLITLIGDGIDQTVIRGDRSNATGWKTFDSATVVVEGHGFVARDLTFENVAGADKGPAVALLVKQVDAAFYRCSFRGYQDTLYVHSGRQFFRECDIYGTVDFIFGNSAVVFQLCNIYARKPSLAQQNVITAQGRDTLSLDTGISILNCRIAAAPDLVPVLSSVHTYLGRPWKPFSTTIIMLSDIGDLIQPAGWMPWDKNNSSLSTLSYREYENHGAGSSTSGRVTWPGYRVITSARVASQFTVANFIGGLSWLPATGVPFYPYLTP